MKQSISRRNFFQSSALIAAACATAKAVPALAAPTPAEEKLSPVNLGLASYTFRNFSRAQMIGFLKQLNIVDLNVKDVKDHLPFDAVEEAKALADYAVAGIKLHAAGAIYFRNDEDANIRAKFEYCKRAGISVIVAGDPTPETLPRIEKFVREKFASGALWPDPILQLNPAYQPGETLDELADKGILRGFKVRRCPLYAIEPATSLPQEAQDAIGLVHVATAPARRLLEQEGMYYEGYVDIFDAGPVLQARVRELRALRDSSVVIAADYAATVPGAQPLLLANTSIQDFRVIAATVEAVGGKLALSATERDLLHCREGDSLRALPMNPTH